MSGVVLDASALLALLLGAPGAERVASVLHGATMSTVNLAEVVGHYTKQGAGAADIRLMLSGLPLSIAPFDEEMAYQVGFMRPAGEKVGLSLGDRACLILARERKMPALSADHAWTKIANECGVEVELIR